MSSKKYVACLSCRRRKIKCSQEPDGCANCARASLQCIYQIPDALPTGVKRKRGPYKKHGLKGLETEADHLASQTGSLTFDVVTGNDPVSTRSDLSESPTKSPWDSPTTSAETSNASTIAEGRSHPPFNQILELWHLYTINVDPVIKIVHCPSFTSKIFEIKPTMQSLQSGTDALMFSIYHAAVSSTSAIEIQKRFGQGKPTLQSHYRKLLESRLAAATASTRSDITTLQALTLYLAYLHRSDPDGVHWTTFILACRIGQQLVDSKNLSIFETQIVRRLWWTIRRLEFRTACKESSKEPPPTVIDWAEVPMPLNLNDVDLDPLAKIEPRPRVGFTDMAFCLLSFELKQLVNAVVKVRLDDSGSDEKSERIIVLERLRLIEDCERKIKDQFLRYCDDSRPLDYMSRRICTIMLSKLKLLTRNILPPTSNPQGDDLTFRQYEKLEMCILILRNMYEIQTEGRIRNWTWFFRDFVQWHALIYALSELCKEPAGPLAEKTWSVLEPILDLWGVGSASTQHEHLEPISKLVLEARRKRAIGSKIVEKPKSDSILEPVTPNPASSDLEPISSQDPICEHTAESESISAGKSTVSELVDIPEYILSEIDNTTTATSFDLNFEFEESLAAFDWEAWANEAQSMNLDFGVS
ncbi:hypothetical protein TWF694_003789 [Orbilia ellipsospora]|uniref:Zn(2)-C6 fungal-type domain-containing protein n=1 Tax=Orbilia ellipsospora TaxID=2528407 RepID=A0AAV9X0K1_9PEZI